MRLLWSIAGMVRLSTVTGAIQSPTAFSNWSASCLEEEDAVGAFICGRFLCLPHLVLSEVEPVWWKREITLYATFNVCYLRFRSDWSQIFNVPIVWTLSCVVNLRLGIIILTTNTTVFNYEVNIHCIDFLNLIN